MVASRTVLIPEVLRELRVKILVIVGVETRSYAEVACPESLLLLCAECVNLAYTRFEPLVVLQYRALTSGFVSFTKPPRQSS